MCRWSRERISESRHWGRRSCKQLSDCVMERKNLPNSYLQAERGCTPTNARVVSQMTSQVNRTAVSLRIAEVTVIGWGRKMSTKLRGAESLTRRSLRAMMCHGHWRGNGFVLMTTTWCGLYRRTKWFTRRRGWGRTAPESAEASIESTNQSWRCRTCLVSKWSVCSFSSFSNVIVKYKNSVQWCTVWIV